MSTPHVTPEDLKQARAIAGDCFRVPRCSDAAATSAMGCLECVTTARVALARAAERARVIAACAQEIDGPCGMDALNHGMTCAPIVPGGKVYHESRCRREDADSIRALADPPPPASKEPPHE